MQPRCEMRIVRVSPKGGWRNFLASHQLVPLAAARDSRRTDLSANSENSFMQLADGGLGLGGVFHSGSRVNSDGAFEGGIYGRDYSERGPTRDPSERRYAPAVRLA